MRDLQRGAGWAKHGGPPPARGGPHPVPAHSPWGSRGAGTPGNRERPVVAGTRPATGAARLQACPGATSPRSLPPLGPRPAGWRRLCRWPPRTPRGFPGEGVRLGVIKQGGTSPAGPEVEEQPRDQRRRHSSMFGCHAPGSHPLWGQEGLNLPIQ